MRDSPKCMPYNIIGKCAVSSAANWHRFERLRNGDFSLDDEQKSETDLNELKHLIEEKTTLTSFDAPPQCCTISS